MKCYEISVYDQNDSGPQRFGPRKLFKGGGGAQTAVTEQNLPAELKPLASAYADKAIGLSNQTYTPYSGDRFADVNGAQQAGLGMITDRAVNGSPVMNQANQTLTSALQGGNTNPYLDQMVNKAQANVLGNAQQAAVQSGSFGNSGIAEAAAKQMGDVATNMYGGAYDADRGRQMQALGMAQSYGNQQYQDAQQLMNAGQFMQDQQQQQSDFDYQQFQEQQNLPYKQLAAMSGVFGSNLGSSASTKQSGGGGK